MGNKLLCSIGVMAYNEELNIEHLLKSLLNQYLKTCTIKEIIVVASGCTDKTEEIVENISNENDLVTLYRQKKREGKASAINLFLSNCSGDICVVESGDTIPDEYSIENLVSPFQDPQIGMTGAHPVPINSDKYFMGFTVNLFWRLHHELALAHPKLGELIAFRNFVHMIPNNTAVDEASIEAIVTKAGYRIHYAKDAIVHNKGPETIKDFLKQRRRITIGHKHLEKTQDYKVSSMKVRYFFKMIEKELSANYRDIKALSWLSGAICLEIIGRLLGLYDFYLKRKNPFTWDIAESTKNLMNDKTYS